MNFSRRAIYCRHAASGFKSMLSFFRLFLPDFSYVYFFNICSDDCYAKKRERKQQQKYSTHTTVHQYSFGSVCTRGTHTHTRNGIVLSEMRAFCFGFSFVYNSVRMNKFTLDIDIPNEYNRFSCVRERNAKKCHFLMLIKAKLV